MASVTSCALWSVSVAQPQPHPPVRPILGMLARRPELFGLALERVAGRWGPPDLRSDALDFDFTDYYARLMGPDLKRGFCSFQVDMDPAELADVKLWTNEIEREIAEDVADEYPRPLNLDPGYLNDSKLVLASAKDHAHRIYLSQGVFAEITLSYHDRAWRAMPWTYPDYRSEAYRKFFDRAREAYLRERKPCR